MRVQLQSSNAEDVSDQAWEREAAAVYIAELAKELASIAKRHDLGSLSYLLDLASMEPKNSTLCIKGRS